MAIPIVGKFIMDTAGAAKSLKDVDDELDNVRERLVAGSEAAKQFDSSITDTAREQMAMVKRAAQIAELSVKSIGANIAGKLGGFLGMKQADKMKVTQKQMLEAEDEIAEMLVSQKFTQEELLILSQKQAALESLRIRYYSQAATEDRLRVNAAKEALGEQLRAQELLRVQVQEEKQIAIADRIIVAEKIIGRGKIAQMLKSEIEWQHQINQAYREGKDELVKTLTAQRNLDLAQQMAAQKRQTPRERIEARTEARKLAGDAKKQGARNASLDRDILRGARGTENSRLEERRRQNAARNKALLAPEQNKNGPEIQLFNEMKAYLADIKTNTAGSLVIKQGGG